LLKSRTDAEDVVQECICRLLKHTEQYNLPRDGRRLLFRAVTNACLNLKSRRRSVLSLDQIGRLEGEGTWEFEDTTTHSPVTLVLTEEMRMAIAEGLGQLSISHRAALELASLGYKPREIAQMMNIDPEHARVNLNRARRLLAAFLRSRFPE